MPRWLRKSKEEPKNEERKKLLDEVLGMNKSPSDVCIPDYCSYSKIDRKGDKSCKEGHPPGKKEYCEWCSDPKYRQKTSQVL